MMPSTEIVYGLTGVGLFALGLRGALLQRALLGRVLAINVCGAGIFLVLVALAYRGTSLAPDPVPHALVLTGIVVAVSATALAIALSRRLHEGSRGPDDPGTITGSQPAFRTDPTPRHKMPLGQRESGAALDPSVCNSANE